MAITVSLFQEGATPEQFDTVRNVVNWDNDVPKGLMYHIASFDDRGLYITTVWESNEDFQRFFENRLVPAVTQLGFENKPQIEIRPVYWLFAPACEVAKAA